VRSFTVEDRRELVNASFRKAAWDSEPLSSVLWKYRDLISPIGGTSEAFLPVATSLSGSSTGTRASGLHRCPSNTRNRARPGSRAHSGLRRGWNRDGRAANMEFFKHHERHTWSRAHSRGGLRRLAGWLGPSEPGRQPDLEQQRGLLLRLVRSFILPIVFGLSLEGCLKSGLVAVWQVPTGKY
jgi:hypothetical protein